MDNNKLIVTAAPHITSTDTTQKIMQRVCLALLPTLIASVIIGETFAAGEVAFIMQIGSFLEETTVARARAGIEKLVRLTNGLDGHGSPFLMVERRPPADRTGSGPRSCRSGRRQNRSIRR